ncbi:hypothetical protein BBJ28_00021838 [Nothophytophthora sp. Chile5]|nr:hypothetical protein BBJ28_00021838 [Nothophytophthora sp. Chile5]
MASKFAKPMQVPAAFPDILRNFTREVLRQQSNVETKEAIYAFGVQYFKELVAKQSGANKAVEDPANSVVVRTYMKLEEEAVKDLLVGAFREAQQQNEGMIVYEEFKQVRGSIDARGLDHDVGEQLQFTSSELRALCAEADENEEGVVSCADFLPLAIQAALQLRANQPQRLLRIEAFSQQDAEFFLHGMMQDEMESILREIFQRADKEEAGALGRLAFMEAIRDADLGLTRREVNVLMYEAPVAEDDPAVIVYQDFIPICFPILKDAFAQGVMEGHSDQEWLTQYLTEVFASGDSETSGLLTVAEIARLFRAADVGLTRLQITAAMAEAQEDKSGFVNYEKFAIHVAGMVLVLTNVDSQQSNAAYLQKYRKTSEYYTVLDLNQHTFEQTLSRALEAVDESRRGILTRGEVSEAVRNAFPEITDRQMRSLMALTDPDEMGELDYNFITLSAFQALQKLQEYDLMITDS